MPCPAGKGLEPGSSHCIWCERHESSRASAVTEGRKHRGEGGVAGS